MEPLVYIVSCFLIGPDRLTAALRHHLAAWPASVRFLRLQGDVAPRQRQRATNQQQHRLHSMSVHAHLFGNFIERIVGTDYDHRETVCDAMKQAGRYSSLFLAFAFAWPVPQLRRILFRLQEVTHPGRANGRGFRLHPLKASVSPATQTATPTASESSHSRNRPPRAILARRAHARPRENRRILGKGPQPVTVEALL